MKLWLKVLDWLFTNWHDLLLHCWEFCNLSSLLAIFTSWSWKWSSLIILLIIIIRRWPNLVVNYSENWNLNWVGSAVGIKCKICTVTKLVNQTYNWQLWNNPRLCQLLKPLKYQSLAFWIVCCESKMRPWNGGICWRNPRFLLKTVSKFSS